MTHHHDFRRTGSGADLRLPRSTNQPALVGYLLAGIVIGPLTPGFVADAAKAAQFAEIGVMLLMLGVGLRFPVTTCCREEACPA